MRSPSSRRRVTTGEELYTFALRALRRRAHSIHELRAYLERQAVEKRDVAPVIARLREQNYLNDARYALDFARQHAHSRRQGRWRIARELRARGVPDRHIQAALETVFAQTAEVDLIRTRIQKRLAGMRGVIDHRQMAGLYRSLLRAGFSTDLIRAELEGLTRGDALEWPDADGSALEMEGENFRGTR